MKKILILITISLIALDAFAQRKVSGTVFDRFNNEPLWGVTVIEVGTTDGVLANRNGYFELQTRNDTTELLISLIGMLNEKIKITSDTIITVFLQRDESACWDVIIPVTRRRTIFRRR